MARARKTWTLAEIAQLVGGELHGPGDLSITRPVPSHLGDPHGVSFAEKPSYLAEAEVAGVGAILVGPGLEPAIPFIRVGHARLAFARVLGAFQVAPPLAPGISPHAVIGEDVRIAEDASIGPFAVIEEGATIGAGAKIYAHCYIGENCVVGEHSVLYPGVTLVQDVVVGARCILHAGVVLGADGFGFAWDGQRHMKIPQVGGVVIGSDCELGAGTCVDRATCGETTVGDGTKVDNMVQIGHNGRIGRHVILAGQIGIAGSVTLGDGVICGGQAAFKDHVKVADGVVLAGRAGVMRDITEKGEYFGVPAVPMREAMRQMAIIQKLPEMEKRLRKIEKERED